MSSRAKIMLDMVMNSQDGGRKVTVKSINSDHAFELEEMERREESPLPPGADMNVIDQMMEMFSESDLNDLDTYVSPNKTQEEITLFNENVRNLEAEKNIEVNENQLPEKNEDSIQTSEDRLVENITPLPSPECSLNHLDYDCDNYFCPWYIEKSNQEGPYSVLSCYTDPLSTPQANTPLSSFSESTLNGPKKRKKTTRKDKGNIRRRHVAEWIDNKRKRLRNLGKEYKSRDGTTRLGKSMGPTCPGNCRQKCAQKICNEVRSSIFQNFWNLGNREKQWQCIASLVLKKNKRRVFSDTVSRRNFTLVYRLKVKTEDTHKFIIVCKKMFLNTFSVSEQFVYTALEKIDITSGVIETDQRGRHHNHRKVITEVVVKSVCDHIKSINPVESHYVRSRSDKLYLDGDLNFHRLFELYMEWFDDQSYTSKARTERQYRDIANEHFKLSFYVPKKDQCDRCHIFKNTLNPPLDKIQFHELHLRNKELARNRKNSDKELAKTSNGKVLAATFDFQKVLNAPHGNLSVLYYKRKLSIFNFTIFNLSEKEGTCYMWHEGQGKRGANEVSSCLIKFIKKYRDLGVTEFRFWSDNCVGQNRNRIVYAMYMYAATTLQVSIYHSFLEVGHTQNEGDSVHALIEKNAKNKLIYTPHDWYCMVRWAKQNDKPYIVEEMQHTDFFNFKLLLQGNWVKSNNGDKIQWNKIREVCVRSDDSYKLYFKYDMADENYKELIVKKSTRKQSASVTFTPNSVEPLYSNILPIPKAKKDDLINMCNSGIIPSTYHNFFTSLPSINNSTNDLDSDSD